MKINYLFCLGLVALLFFANLFHGKEKESYAVPYSRGYEEYAVPVQHNPLHALPLYPQKENLPAFIAENPPVRTDLGTEQGKGLSGAEFPAVRTVSLTAPFAYTLGEAQLTGAAGSLPEETELSIRGLDTSYMPPLDAGMVNVTGAYDFYRMLPHGTRFTQDIQVILPYDKERLPHGFTPKDIHTYYYNDTLKRWIAITRDSVDTENNRILSRVNHFTDFINAVIKVPEMPETEAFVPTFMNDMKPADPMAGIQIMQAPAPNNQGSANLSYPIPVPAGRQGIQPNLAVTYNSSGGGGWMGMGWDLSIPAITIETRWGVPHYDPLKESETYLYNGQQLATKNADGEYDPLSHRALWVDRKKGEVQFYPYTEGAFDKIIRHGNSPKNYWWEVRDKNGTIYYYGKQLGADVYDPDAVLTDGSRNIARWGLTEIRDLHGNFAWYQYEKVTKMGKGSALYIKQITYTGHDTEPGKYTVYFHRVPRSTYGFTDITTHARNGLMELTDDLLERVLVAYNNTVISGYKFCYKAGSFEKTLLCSMEALLSENLNIPIESAVAADIPCECTSPLCCQNPPPVQAGRIYFDYHQGYTSFGQGVGIPTGDNTTEHIAGKLTPGTSVRATSLGGTATSGWSTGGAGTIGLGKDVSKKGLTIGGNFQYGDSESDGLLTLVDIDGDGLPDKLYKTGGNLFYRKQLYNAVTRKYTFSEPVAINVSGTGGIRSFLKDVSTNNAWGIEGNVSWNGFGIVGADSWNWTKSSSSYYMSDVDGDGLPDLIQNGYVFFNRGKEGNEHKFILNTSSTVMVGGACGGQYIYQDEGINEDMYTPGNEVSTTICRTDSVWVIKPNLIFNGDFELGNIGFSSEYNFVTSSADFSNDETYGIVHTAHDLEPNCYPIYDDVYGINGKYMTIRAFEYGSGGYSRPMKAWSQTVPVTPHTWYRFEFSAATMHNYCSYHLPNLKVSINGVQMGDSLSPIYYNNLPYYMEITMPEQLKAYYRDHPWSKFQVDWYSGNNITADMTITDWGQARYIYALDNIFFGIPRMEYTTVCETVSDTIKEHYEFKPDHDAVKVWKAPYQGRVLISSTICLPEELADKGKEFHVTDGFKASIQHNGTILWQQMIAPDSADLCHTPGLFVNVNKGDRIYFRLESLHKRTYDQAYWHKSIAYKPPAGQNPDPGYTNLMESPAATETVSLADNGQMGTMAFTPPMLCTTWMNSEEAYNREDADGKKIYIFDGKEDFLINPLIKYQMPLEGAGKIRIESQYAVNKPLSEVITLRIYHNGNRIAGRSIPKRTVAGHTAFDVASLNVMEGDSIWFQIYAPTNVDWNAIDWKIRYYYTASSQPHVVLWDPISIPGDSLPVVMNDNVVPHCTNFPKPVFPTSFYLCDQNNVVNNITVTVPGAPHNAEATFSIKDASGSVLNATNQLVNGQFTMPFPTPVTLNAHTLYYLDIFLKDTVSDNITQSSVKINNSYFTAGLHARHKVQDLKFGDMYRNWGQFTYKKDSIDGEAIVESRLNFSNRMNSIDTDFTELDTSAADFGESFKEMMQEQYDPLKENFLMMNPDYLNKRWLGYGNVTYIAADTLSNTYPFATWSDETEFPVPQTKHDAPVQAPRKHTYNDGETPSFAAMASIISAGKAWPKGSSTVLSEYMDMNGDRFPDHVSEYQIQYSKPQGGLNKVPVGKASEALGIELSNYKGSSRNFGATFPIVSKKYNVKRSNSQLELGGNAGVSGSDGNNTEEGDYIWTDMNGDGLPDKVYRSGTVLYNLGYKYQYGPPMNTGSQVKNAGSVSSGGSMSISGSLQEIPNASEFDIAGASISGGFGTSRNTNKSNVMFMDVNGDGLPDKVSTGTSGTMQVAYNTGTGFIDYGNCGLPTGWKPLVSESYTGSINGAFSFGFPIPILFITIKIMVNPQNSKSWGVNRTEGQFIDMNGDGLPDYVTSGDQSSLTVYYNQTGKMNLLSGVRQAQMEFSMDYELTQNSYESPQRFWVMNKVEVTTPLYENHTTYQYENPYYDRYEREQLGFETVTTEAFDNNGEKKYEVVEKYHKTDLMRKGLKHYELLTANGRKYIEKQYLYRMAEIATGNFIPGGWEFCFGEGYPVLEWESVDWYEGENNPGMRTEKHYTYGPYGNIKGIRDKGNPDNPYDDLIVRIGYHTDNTNRNLAGIANFYSEEDSETAALRTIQSEIAPQTGKATRSIRHGGSDGNPVYDFEYDEYGNRIRFIKPENQNGERMEYTYTYDPELHTYPVAISDNLGYATTADYDYRWGAPLFKTDINGNNIEYQYDSRGRLKQVKAPDDPDYSIRCFYSYDGEITAEPDKPAARTDRYDVQHPDNPLTTISIAYGAGVIQTKVNAEINGQEEWIVSGKTQFDYRGQPVRQWAPVTETGISYIYQNAQDAAPPLQSVYDILGRVTYMQMPDGTENHAAYGFAQDHSGAPCFVTDATDANGNISHTYTDVRGRQTQMVDPYGGVTRFRYSIWNELRESVDPEDHYTNYGYDILGRQTHRMHPDAGLEEFRYDPAGNLIARRTENLGSSSGAWIVYDYDYNRLIGIHYPEHPENNVIYEYGQPGAPHNRAGRIARMEDASGYREYFYGNMGEVIEDLRTFVIPNDWNTYSFRMRYEYDTWNRMMNMAYPDGERIAYTYNYGGQLQSVYGDQPYIQDIHYDKFGNKIRKVNGNGVTASYQYDTMQRLQALTTYTPYETLQDLTYQYDNVGNITRIENFAGITSGGLGGYYSDNYSYDPLSRLTYAYGNVHNPYIANPQYNLQMNYTPNGKISHKSLHAEKSLNGIMSTDDYNIEYHYNGNRLMETYYHGHCYSYTLYDWDMNGNMKRWENYNRGLKSHCWDEENRLMTVNDGQYSQQTHFIYDAAGERTLKMNGLWQSMYINGQGFDGYFLDRVTLYASPYLVVNSQGYTKHYYAGSERFGSRLGTGTLPEIDANNPGYHALYDKKQKLDERMQNNCDEGAPAIVAENYFSFLWEYRDNPPAWVIDETYYYHTDHLGSSSWITDHEARTVQYLRYLPYGETQVDQRTTGWNSMYTFSGKEKDEETGYSYFGARYYWDELSIWLSVDPLADMYPNTSSYMYCLGNPVRLIDPTGMIVEPTDDENINNKINPEHKDYNKAFHDQYKKLDADKKTLYRFNKINSSKENGVRNEGYVDSEGKKDGLDVISINYIVGNDIFTSKDFSLLEETFHAIQFMKGDFGFYENGPRGAFGLDLWDEAEAKIFAAQNTLRGNTELERGILKANEKGDLNGVVNFMKRRPSMQPYIRELGHIKKRISAIEALENEFPGISNSNNIDGVIMRR